MPLRKSPFAAVGVAAAVCVGLFWLVDSLFNFVNLSDSAKEELKGLAFLFEVGSGRVVYRVLTPLILVAAAAAVFNRLGFARPEYDAVTASRESGFDRSGLDQSGFSVRPRKDSERPVQRNLQEAIETVPVALALYDTEDRLVLCNRLYRSLCALPDLHSYGTKFETLVRETAKCGYVKDAIGREEEWIAERMDMHRNPQGIIEQKTAKGHRVLIEHRTADGFTLLVIQDITDLRQAEANLHEALHQAQIANQAKSTFLANMSHELRTPLNCVIGFSEILASEMLGPLGHPKYKEYVGDIRQAGNDLLDIISDILDLSRIEAGRIVLRDQKVALSDLLSHCARIVAPQIRDLELEFNVRCPSDLPAVLADEHRLRQVLFNLLSNAIKFTPPKGCIDLMAEMDRDDRITISVVDTGIGIAEENLAGILSPFVQVEEPFNRRYDGAGLGLPLAKSLMELHGGELAIDSILGKGTVVTIRFPVERTVRTD